MCVCHLVIHDAMYSKLRGGNSLATGSKSIAVWHFKDLKTTSRERVFETGLIC